MATLQQLDMNILLWIQEHLRVDALTPFWRAVTFLGNGGWFWIVLCVLLICFGKTRKTGINQKIYCKRAWIFHSFCQICR